METSRNIPKVLAIMLRAAVKVLRGETSTADAALLTEEGAAELVAATDNAIESIEAVAEELEQLAAAPDPDGGVRG